MSYCLREGRTTGNKPGSESYSVSVNGRNIIKSICATCGAKKASFVSDMEGGKFSLGKVLTAPIRTARRLTPTKRPKLDVHAAIGWLPKPKAGWTPGKNKYLGPYNPLDQQVIYDKKTGKISKYIQQPLDATDAVASRHDTCYAVGRNKNECDKEMLQEFDGLAKKGQLSRWGKVARPIIGTKKFLGVGANMPKGRRR